MLLIAHNILDLLNMLFDVGLFVILFLGLLKICQPYILAKLPSKQFQRALEVGNIDKILRGIQYICIYLIGDNKISQSPHCYPLQGLIGSSWIQLYRGADRLKMFIRNIRKVIRFVRGPQLVVNLWKKLSFPKISAEKLSFSWIKMLNLVESVTKILGQACLIIFYLTDHHQTFYQIGMIDSEQSRAGEIGDFGIEMRMWFSIFLAISISANYLKNCLEAKDGKSKRADLNKLFKTASVEMLAHLADILLFYGVLHKGFISKKRQGILGVIASTLRFSRVL